MVLFVSLTLLVVGGCFVYARVVRKSYVEQFDEKKEEYLKLEQEYTKKVTEIAKVIQPNLDGKTIINGKYIKSVKIGLQVTTYYSFLIILDPDNHHLQVLSYRADTKEAKDCGYFTKEQVEPINIGKGGQTNYKFLDENLNEKLVVQTFAAYSSLAYNSDYELQYPQLEAYSKLRHFFGLATDSKLIMTGEGEQERNDEINQ